MIKISPTSTSKDHLKDPKSSASPPNKGGPMKYPLYPKDVINDKASAGIMPKTNQKKRTIQIFIREIAL